MIRKIFFFFVLFLLNGITGFSQENTIDSLQNIINKKNCKNKDVLYNEIALNYSLLGNFPKTKTFLDSAIIHSEINNNNSELSKSYILKGRINLQLSEYSKAYLYLNKALIIARKNNDFKGEYYALLLIANYHEMQGNQSKAEEYTLQCFNLCVNKLQFQHFPQIFLKYSNFYFKKAEYNKAYYFAILSLNSAEYYNTKKIEIEALINLGNLSTLVLNNNEKALEYYLKANKISVTISDLVKDAIVIKNIANIYYQKQEFETALNYYEIAEKKFIQMNYQFQLNDLYQNIAFIYKSQGNFELANINFIKSIKISTNINDLELLAETKANYAAFLLAWNKPDNVEKLLLSSLSISDSLNFIVNKKLCSKILSSYYSKVGNYKESVKYYEKFITINDSLINIEKVKTISELEYRFETEKKEKSLLLKNYEIEAKNKQLFFSMFVIFIISSILALIIMFNLKIKKKNNLLLKHNLEIVDILRKQKAVTKSIDENIIEIKNIKYNTSSLDEQSKNKLYQKIVTVLENEKIYLDNELSLDKFAEHIDTNRTYLSQIINEFAGVNFNTFINKYKVNEARLYLSNPENSDIPIKTLYDKFGFGSNKYFYEIFKKETGISPNFYRTEILKKNQIAL